MASAAATPIRPLSWMSYYSKPTSAMLWFERLEEDCGIAENQLQPPPHKEGEKFSSIFLTIISKVRPKSYPFSFS